MIETGTVDGKKATLSYVDDMLVPVDDKADATMIVAWVEDGHVLYLRVPGKPVKDAGVWNEELHPRERGRFTFSVAYHGTVEDVAEKIGKEGITVQRKKTFARVNPHYYEGERGQSVFITSSYEDALNYAIGRAKAGRTVAGNPVVFRLEVPKSEWDSFNADTYHAGMGAAKFRKKAIPAKWIKAYTLFEKPLIGVFAPKPKQKQEVKLRDAEESIVTVYMIVWADDGVKDAWREDLHPRGQPTNKGQFGPGGGGVSSQKEALSSARRLVKRARASGRSVREQHEHEIAKGMRPATPRAAAKAQHAAVTQAEASKMEKGKAKSRDDFAKAKINLRGASDEAKFLKTWNEQVGMSPEEFKNEFLGGVPSSMEISFYGDWMKVEGMLAQREGGPPVGRYDRDIYLKDKKAYSAFFKIEKAYTDSDIGKKVLAGNVAVYEKMGITSVGVTANIDVGGYAWAKYGYVPTQAAWDGLRGKLAQEAGGAVRGTSTRGSRHDEDENKMDAEEWSFLSDDQQTEVRDRWMRDNRQDYLESEIDSWRDSGQALEDAKKQLNYEYDSSNLIPRWADEELNELRDKRELEEQPPIPFTNQQLFEALKMEEYDGGGDGSADPEFEWDDSKLQEPKDLPPSEQLQLPGVKPPDYSKRIDDEMREEITDRLVYAFNSKADSDQQYMDAPDYLGESVDEYMDQAWDEKNDREKLEIAEGYNLHRVPAPEDEDAEEEEEEEKQKEMQMEKKTPPAEEVKAEEKPKTRTLIEIANDPRPKAMWEFADAPGGKAVLLAVTKHRSWSGMLNLKDKESYDRFKKYVGRVKEKKRAA